MFNLATKDDIDRLLARLEQISAEHKLQQESLRDHLLDRLRELEEIVANPPKPEPVKDPKDEVVPGFVPHSARKRNFERANRRKE